MAGRTRQPRNVNPRTRSLRRGAKYRTYNIITFRILEALVILKCVREYTSEVIILNHEPAGDLDRRYSLFAKKFGKLVARAKSVRKIASKLSSHLEPGSCAQVRLVEKNGLKIADALKKSRLSISPASLYFLDKLLAEAEPEAGIWPLLFSSELDWQRILQILGWDPKIAACSVCGHKEPPVFDVKRQEFFCRPCSSKIDPKELLYIYPSPQSG